MQYWFEEGHHYDTWLLQITWPFSYSVLSARPIEQLISKSLRYHSVFSSGNLQKKKVIWVVARQKTSNNFSEVVLPLCKCTSLSQRATYVPGQGGGSRAKLPPPSRSTRKSCTLRGIISARETGCTICSIHLHKKCSPCALCRPLSLVCYRWKFLLPQRGKQARAAYRLSRVQRARGWYYERPLHHCLSGTEVWLCPSSEMAQKHFVSTGRTHF